MLNRRKFIKGALVAGAGLWAMPSMAVNGYDKITIFHTNDMHCHFEPFAESDPRFPGRGGMNRISAYMKHAREIDPDVLFFDCGDFCQGTPYYNFFKSELVFKLMSEMGYHAAAVGNHEFDFGLEDIRNGLEHANFPLISSNYDFTGTPVEGLIKKNIVLERKGVRIGVYGLGIELQGLVGKSLYGNTVYSDPIETALAMEEYLHQKEKCDLIVCLSHLGFSYDSQKVSDKIIARKTRYTDVIIGGHTHVFLDSPAEELNAERKPVVINQVGWAALMLGKLEFYIEKQKLSFIDMSPNINIG